MSNKAKGSRNERELLKIFTEQGWRAVRVAGSGVGEDSPCDLIASKIGKKAFTIEVKSTKNSAVYISKNQIEDFILFSNIIGLNSVIVLDPIGAVNKNPEWSLFPFDFLLCSDSKNGIF